MLNILHFLIEICWGFLIMPGAFQNWEKLLVHGILWQLRVLFIKIMLMILCYFFTVSFLFPLTVINSKVSNTHNKYSPDQYFFYVADNIDCRRINIFSAWKYYIKLWTISWTLPVMKGKANYYLITKI